jgi:hypothetical protein
MKLTGLPPLSLLTQRIESDRASAARELVPAFERQARAVRDLIDEPRRSPRAAGEIDTGAREILAAYRAIPARSLGAFDAFARIADTAFRSERQEILDSSHVPPFVKHAAMLGLEFVNRCVGSYDLWRRALARRVDDLATPHLYELAAGTGGFSRWLAAQNVPYRLTCSDLEAGYVVVGASLAERKRLPLKFEPRSVTELGHLKSIDLFFTSQAVHHLTPGIVVTMMREAVRIASRGLLLVDLLRSPANAIGTVAGIATTLPLPVLLADGFQSVRRAYTLGELELLARFAGVAQIEAETLGPVHGVVHLRGLAEDVN